MKIMYAVPDKIHTLEEYLELDFETTQKKIELLAHTTGSH